MSDFANYAEYSVKRKNDRTVVLRKILFISFYIIYVIAFLVFCLKTGIIQIGALIPLTLWIIVFFTWRYTSIEYEYIISSGTLTVSAVYGNVKRKTLVERKVKDMSAIAPFDERGKSYLQRINPKDTIFALSSENSPSAYYAVFEDEGGQKSAVLFDTSEQMLKIMRFYNPSTVVKTDAAN